MPQPSVRMCAVCRQRRDRATLLRVARLADGGLVIDPRSRLPGRGAWVCRTQACWEPAALRTGLSRGFKARVEADRVETLIRQLRRGLDEGAWNRAQSEPETATAERGVAGDSTMR
ncbi:MAG: YlxR family protein [Caldilineae bacterium]|nr:YlxR family protein [Chloroflexota bacterium]MCB9177453.1 YlxR family protein [Caldilineae bacterium]